MSLFNRLIMDKKGPASSGVCSRACNVEWISQLCMLLPASSYPFGVHIRFADLPWQPDLKGLKICLHEECRTDSARLALTTQGMCLIR